MAGIAYEQNTWSRKLGSMGCLSGRITSALVTLPEPEESTCQRVLNSIVIPLHQRPCCCRLRVTMRSTFQCGTCLKIRRLSGPKLSTRKVSKAQDTGDGLIRIPSFGSISQIALFSCRQELRLMATMPIRRSANAPSPLR